MAKHNTGYKSIHTNIIKYSEIRHRFSNIHRHFPSSFFNRKTIIEQEAKQNFISYSTSIQYLMVKTSQCIQKKQCLWKNKYEFKTENIKRPRNLLIWYYNWVEKQNFAILFYGRKPQNAFKYSRDINLRHDRSQAEFRIIIKTNFQNLDIGSRFFIPVANIFCVQSRLGTIKRYSVFNPLKYSGNKERVKGRK